MGSTVFGSNFQSKIEGKGRNKREVVSEDSIEPAACWLLVCVCSAVFQQLAVFTLAGGGFFFFFFKGSPCLDNVCTEAFNRLTNVKLSKERTCAFT